MDALRLWLLGCYKLTVVGMDTQKCTLVVERIVIQINTQKGGRNGSGEGHQYRIMPLSLLSGAGSSTSPERWRYILSVSLSLS